jgi:hypothetical protein
MKLKVNLLITFLIIICLSPLVSATESTTQSFTAADTYTLNYGVQSVSELLKLSEVNLNFNGATSKVTVPNSEDLNYTFTNITISAWFKPEAINFSNQEQEWSRIVQKDSYTLAPNKNQKYINFQIKNSTGDYISINSDVIEWNAGDWYNIVATVNNGIMILYVNGTIQTGLKATSGILEAGIDDLIIGNKVDTTRTFNGSIDEVRIYNNSLTQAQITDLASQRYTNTSLLTDNLIAYYVFNENTGSTLHDLIKDNHGTLSATTWETNQSNITLTTSDYSFNDKTLTLLNDNYDWSYFTITYSINSLFTSCYDVKQSYVNFSEKLALISLIITAIVIMGFIFLMYKGRFDNEVLRVLATSVGVIILVGIIITLAGLIVGSAC